MTHGAADGSVAETNLELTDPEEEQVSGTIAALPSDMDLSSIALFVGRIPVPQTLAPGPFMLVVPTTPLKVALTVTGTNQSDSGQSSVTRLRPASGAWDLALPKPPKLILPVEDAKGITPDVSFSWASLPASVVATITWRVGSLTIRRTTSGTSAKLPDLEPYGMVYEAGLQDGWDVQGVGPAASVDEQMALNDALYAASAPLDVTVLRSASRALQLAE
jgi:hypothetical protein